jgi:polysaccharide deacetylase 2 family uncharacterized protein YibQ
MFPQQFARLPAVAADDLSAPLGQQPKKPRFAVPVAVPRALAGLLGVCLLTFLAWTVLISDPLGGEPMVVVSADPRAPAQGGKPDQAGSRPAASPSSENAPAPGTQTVTIIDGMSGKRQEVAIAGGATRLPEPVIEQRNVESSRHGSLPKIAADGTRPSDTYASPQKASLDKVIGPRIAIVVGGLGIGQAGTFEALGKLPGPVTLAFAPYGNDLPRWVARARREGHEVLLQVPMEPFDYPDNDPGPQTLLTSLTPAQNLDRLHWFMSRFQGYVGIANYMGGRFTADENAFAPLLRETGRRGLIYFDDGTSARSVANQLAGANNASFLKADVVLDAASTPAAIDGALGRLETMARERGSAVGVATALPVSIDRIAQWAKAAEGRGIVLVPVSAVASKAKAS